MYTSKCLDYLNTIKNKGNFIKASSRNPAESASDINFVDLSSSHKSENSSDVDMH